MLLGRHVATLPPASRGAGPLVDPNAAAAQTAVRPGALTQLIAELAQAPDPAAGWDVPLLPGDVVGRFEVVRVIGRGGFGVVHEARDLELGRSVALKVVRSAGTDPLRDARTLGEAEAAARLAHPNIVHLYDVGRCDKGAYLIMELLRGRPLSEWAGSRVAVRDAVRVGVEVSRGLAHAHAAGVVHRDLKPANVFVCDDGQVKVLDFGLAHVFGRAAEEGGTPAYMAPEQARGEVGDERVDVYSLGIILRDLLGGTQHSSGVGAEEGGPPSLHGAPAALARLVVSMLEPDPDARPRDGREVYAALVAVQKALEPRRLLWATGIVAVLALAAAGALAVRARPLPPGRLLVAMADTENATGDPDLDAVSELLGMGLEQSRRVSLLARSRIVNVIRESGESVPRAIGEGEVRSAARKAQAQVLLVPAVRRSGSGYDVAIRAADVARDEPLFSLRESAAAKATIPAALDRLTKRVRTALQENPSEAPKRAVTATEMAPIDPGALRLYSEGKRLESEARFDEARRAHQAAIEAAPEFLPPRVEILQGDLWNYFGRIAQDETEEHRRVLRKNLQRLPEKERMYIEVFLGEFGNSTDFLAALDRAIEAWPEDPRPYVLAAQILFEDRGDLEAARPYIEKALVIAPLAVGATIDHLIALGRLDDALARARRWTVEFPSSVSFMNLSEVHRIRGEIPEALEAARRGLNMRTFVDADALEEGEALVRAIPEKGPLRPWMRWLTLRGRITDAIAEMDRDAPGPEVPARAHASYGFWRSFLLAHRGDPEPLWQSWVEAVRHGRVLPPCTLWFLAFLGDPERAATIAPEWPSDHRACLRVVEAMATWKRGDREAALGTFARIQLATTQVYRGEILWELGRDREAIESFRAYRRMRGATWSDISLEPWHYPRSLYFEALALERLGERAQALAVTDRLLHLWAQADPGLPLLAETKALRARVAGAVPDPPKP